ncbi:MAG: PIN domain-containing protein [Verrucomicrobiales bacterium]
MTSGSLCFDTSVVMRLLARDPKDQYHRASAFLKEQLTAGVSVLVPDLVLVEAYFALQAFYQLPKKEALAALDLFARHSGATVTPVARAVLAQPNLATAKPGFVGRLIHGTSHAAGHTLVTFDKAAKKLPSTFLLPCL